jgi:hypothetical protein
MRQKRKSSVTKKCRLLCPQDGCGVQRVVKVGDPITLACGHERGELLPLQPGHISIEHLVTRTKLGLECFPAVLQREMPVDAQPFDAEMAGLPVPSDAEVIACLEALSEVHNAIEY